MSRVWSPGAYETARRMWANGYSGAQIAKEIRVSRSSLMGVVHRNRQDFAPRSRLAQCEAASSERRKRARRKAAGTKVSVAKPVLVVPPVQPMPVVDVQLAPSLDTLTLVPLTFMRAVTEGRCLFFAGEPYAPSGPDMLVCGCRRAENRLRKPYCAAHLAIEIERRVA